MLRLASDLAKAGDKFVIHHKESRIYLNKTIVDDGNPIVEAYVSNGAAASPIISLRGTLTAMGIPSEVQKILSGTYKVIVDEKGIEFDLNRELK